MLLKIDFYIIIYIIPCKMRDVNGKGEFFEIIF